MQLIGTQLPLCEACIGSSGGYANHVRFPQVADQEKRSHRTMHPDLQSSSCDKEDVLTRIEKED